MKKILISLLLIISLCACVLMGSSVAFAAEEGSGNPLLVDKADLLTASEEAALLTRLRSISVQYQAEVIVITVENMGGRSADDYVEYLYDSMGYGYGADRDGVMFLISMEEREYRILSNGFAAEAITAGDIENISDLIVTDLSNGDYADAFNAFADECEYYLNGYINGFPFDAGATLLVSVVIGLIVGLIVVLVLRGQLKSVRQQNQANTYVKNGSMHLTQAHELYLYRNVTRVQRQSSSSSSSSGSSRNVGGGRF